MKKHLRPNRVEGYWYAPYERYEAYPMPIARKKAWKGEKEFLLALNTVQENNEDDKDHYKGWSICRLCGKKNGTSAFNVIGAKYSWHWPSGLWHYIEVHHVKPSPDFIKFILEEA